MNDQFLSCAEAVYKRKCKIICATVRMGINRLYYSFEYKLIDLLSPYSVIEFSKEKSRVLHMYVENMMDEITSIQELSFREVFERVKKFLIDVLKKWRTRADYRQLDKNFTNYYSDFVKLFNKASDLVNQIKKAVSDAACITLIQKNLANNMCKKTL